MTTLLETRSNALIDSPVKDYTVYEAAHCYNDLISGRVYALIELAAQYEQTPSLALARQMKAIFSRFLVDAYFSKGTLIWLAPPVSKPEQSLFSRNIGIYLGLGIIHRYFNDESSIPVLVNHCCFELELREITDLTLRKRIRQLLAEPDAASPADIRRLLAIFEHTQNRVIFESIFCLSLLSGHFTDPIVGQQLEKMLLVSPEPIRLYVNRLFALVSARSGKARYRLDLCENVVQTLLRNRFQALYAFCGNTYVEQLITRNQLDTYVNPGKWLDEIYVNYSNKGLLFRQLIGRERFLLNMPLAVFDNQAPDNVQQYHLDFLQACYESDRPVLYSFRFRLDRSKFIHQFSSFCIKLLMPQDFSTLNHPLKFTYFSKYYRHRRFSLLLVKRHEKAVVWQGRSFTDNAEVDFLYFFMDGFASINDYKHYFGDKALPDVEVLELLFWALELGIVEPHYSD